MKNYKNRFKDLDNIHQETEWSKEDLWSSIEGALNKGSIQDRFLITRKLPWAAIFLIGLAILFYTQSTDRTYLSIEVSVAPQIEQILIETSKVEEGKVFINESCAKQLKVCESPKFLSLSADLDLIDAERSGLIEMMGKYGKDETMMKALIQLENAEAEVTSEMIKIILS